MKTNTIKQVVRDVFELMPTTFNTVEFIATVKTHCSVRLNKFPFDSTILRQLRELRTDDPMKYDWQCIDHAKSVYQKIEWKPEPESLMLTDMNNICKDNKPFDQKAYIYNYTTELKGYSAQNNLPKQNIFQKLFNKK